MVNDSSLFIFNLPYSFIHVQCTYSSENIKMESTNLNLKFSSLFFINEKFLVSYLTSTTKTNKEEMINFPKNPNKTMSKSRQTLSGIVETTSPTSLIQLNIYSYIQRTTHSVGVYSCYSRLHLHYIVCTVYYIQTQKIMAASKSFHH